MNNKPLSFCSRVVGYTPQRDGSFLLTESKAWPSSIDTSGFFRADGVHIDFQSYQLNGAETVYLTLPDAEVLVEHLQGVIDKLRSLREATES